MNDVADRLAVLTIRLEQNERVTTQEVYDLALLAMMEIRKLTHEKSVLEDKLLHFTG